MPTAAKTVYDDEMLLSQLQIQGQFKDLKDARADRRQKGTATSGMGKGGFLGWARIKMRPSSFFSKFFNVRKNADRFSVSWVVSLMIMTSKRPNDDKFCRLFSDKSGNFLISTERSIKSRQNNSFQKIKSMLYLVEAYTENSQY
uniref:Uncharacterized protein n=1 Tax=Romanomermis culicivorax TaxID=13658 RepID=A0A915JL40_ROMCU